jgi:enterochelin esterase-like enzyme
MRKRSLSILPLTIALVACSASAQSDTIVLDEIHAASLEGNLIGDSPNRVAMVYLPPDYNRQKNTRYPVAYFLGGFGVTDSAARITRGTRFVQAISRAIAEKRVPPLIVVIANGGNRFGGSYYTNSIATGNWEDYVVRDLVSHVDGKYRTIARSESRGITGHSMGGYGAIKLAMKHPDVFGAVYGTSSCCLDQFPGKEPTDAQMQEAAAIQSWGEFAATKKFLVRTLVAQASAFSPNPSKPPFFADFPLTKSGEPDSTGDYAKARWLANIPKYMVDSHLTNLAALRGIAFSAGTREPGIQSANRTLSEVLRRNKIEHTYEVFEGGHNDKVFERIETRILPFFSRTLVFQK